MNAQGALNGIKVVQGEGRHAVAVCARLLAQLGADVVSAASVADVFVGAPDAVATTSASVRCSISATGALRHPEIGPDVPEIVMQALGGLMSTSGNADGAPEPVRIPILEAFTGIDAAASILAALRVAEATGRGQEIDAAVWDSNASLLGTFVAQATAGKASGYRDGSRHSICAPWNAYAARDGYVMICTSSDAQWRKLLDVMGQGAKAIDPVFIDMNVRRNNIAAVDALVEAWTRGHSVAELAPLLKKNGIPAGAIASDAQAIADRLPFKLTASGTPIAPTRRAKTAGVSAKALDGVRVIEIGPFTAGPLVGRSLGDLGADVVKIEPEKGEVSRTWSPRSGHVSGYFANYNIGKKSLVLDLARDADRAIFETLLAGADVLVQNLKAGALDKLGFGVEAVAVRHPQLIYCSISGYGREGAPDAALDTVIQAESGIMAKVGDGATPCKVGFSVADLIAGHLSVLGILAALRRRDRDGVGQQVDVSMLGALQWLMAQGCDYPADAFDGMVTRDDRAEWVLRRTGERDVAVRDLGAVFADASLKARGMLRLVPLSAGASAYVMGSPYQLALTPPVPGPMIGEAGADRDGVIRAWALPPAVHGEVA
jgi:crotonobetainyl-CoA:carnitine CoA-transferase CaiB-like acyl-CoA transferase